MITRAYLALLGWYLAVAAVPALLLQQHPDSPGYTEVSGARKSCVGDLGCPKVIEAGDIFVPVFLWITPSLLVSAPLCWYLVRKWKKPGAAAFTAAIGGWVALCFGAWFYLELG
ncbi:hypothetical protein AB0F72_32335 [Actinoplanes sp. NPDC023936]|uniref:hypothetical protein n=1 Tax=Actinoplanes sp. NPDC023936 TaxID=3154910 RepID=UPI0033C7016D